MCGRVCAYACVVVVIVVVVVLVVVVVRVEVVVVVVVVLVIVVVLVVMNKPRLINITPFKFLHVTYYTKSCLQSPRYVQPKEHQSIQTLTRTRYLIS